MLFPMTYRPMTYRPMTYRNLCTGNCWPELYTLDQNRSRINARLVLEIVLDRLEGSRTHAKLWFD
jgi:hypothetical protein